MRQRVLWLCLLWFAPGAAWADTGREEAKEVARKVIDTVSAKRWKYQIVEKTLQAGPDQPPRREVWFVAQEGLEEVLSRHEMQLTGCKEFDFASPAERPYLSRFSAPGDRPLYLVRYACVESPNLITFLLFGWRNRGDLVKLLEATEESLIKPKCEKRLGLRLEEVKAEYRRVRLVREKFGRPRAADAPVCEAPTVDENRVHFDLQGGCFARVPKERLRHARQPFEEVCVPGKGLTRVLGEVTATGGGRTWNVRLIWSFIYDHPVEAPEHEVKLVVSRGGRKVSELILDEGFLLDNPAVRPYLSVMRLQGRDFLLTRSASTRFTLYEVSVAGRLVKRLEAEQESRILRLCNRLGLRLEADDPEGLRLRLLREEYHRLTAGADMCERPTYIEDTVHFVWMNGCYARVPGEELDHPQKPWEDVCIPGKGIVNKRRPKSGSQK